MVTYDFKCNDCLTVFEKSYDKISEYKKPPKCPNCNGKAKKVLHLLPVVHYKGIGWGGGKNDES